MKLVQRVVKLFVNTVLIVRAALQEGPYYSGNYVYPIHGFHGSPVRRVRYLPQQCYTPHARAAVAVESSMSAGRYAALGRQ